MAHHPHPADKSGKSETNELFLVLWNTIQENPTDEDAKTEFLQQYAFTAFYYNYVNTRLSFKKDYADRKDTVDGIINEVAFACLKSFDPRKGTWNGFFTESLLMACYTQYRGFTRKENKHTSLEGAYGVSSPWSDLDSFIQRKEQALNALRHLTEIQYYIFMKRLYGYSDQEISDNLLKNGQTDYSTERVRREYNRAKAIVKRFLSKDD